MGHQRDFADTGIVLQRFISASRGFGRESQPVHAAVDLEQHIETRSGHQRISPRKLLLVMHHAGDFPRGTGHSFARVKKTFQ